MKLTEDIKPVTYMKTRAAELLRELKQSRRPVIITQHGASFLERGAQGPLTIAGDGESSVLDWRGPITVAIFDFLRRGPARQDVTVGGPSRVAERQNR